MASQLVRTMGYMSTWLSLLAARLDALLDPWMGPYPPQRSDADADLRRVRAELNAIRARFADHS
jgi:hypothetical protein